MIDASLRFNQRLREGMLRYLRPVHRNRRRRKLALFFRMVGESSKGTLLDMGGAWELPENLSRCI